MKKLFLILALVLIFTIPGFTQQINYDRGTDLSGTAYSVVCKQDADSSTTWNILFDLQDYYFRDWNPSVYDSITALNNSDALFIGTLWYMVDAAQAADSATLYIEAYPGFTIYDDNDNNRYETTEQNFSTTAITLRDSSSDFSKGDIQWTPINIYLNASTRVLPPEFLKVKMGFNINSFDGASSGDIYWRLAYFAVYEREQTNRSSDHSKNLKKANPTLH